MKIKRFFVWIVRTDTKAQILHLEVHRVTDVEIKHEKEVVAVKKQTIGCRSAEKHLLLNPQDKLCSFKIIKSSRSGKLLEWSFLCTNFNPALDFLDSFYSEVKTPRLMATRHQDRVETFRLVLDNCRETNFSINPRKTGCWSNPPPHTLTQNFIFKYAKIQNSD